MRTDPALFAALPGGLEIETWFGFTPSFHDATLERLEIGSGAVLLVLAAFRMTDQVDEKGYFICDKHAQVGIQIGSVTGISLNGHADSIIAGLHIRRITADEAQGLDGPREGDFELGFETSYGLEGQIYGREVSLSLTPTPHG